LLIVFYTGISLVSLSIVFSMPDLGLAFQISDLGMPLGVRVIDSGIDFLNIGCDAYLFSVKGLPGVDTLFMWATCFFCVGRGGGSLQFWRSMTFINLPW